MVAVPIFIMFKLFRTFFKIGIFTIGGGYVMLPLIRETVIKKEGWLSEERFLELLTVAQGAPGAMAINLSILIGLELSGLKGALVAMAGTILPSFVSIIMVASILTRFFAKPYIHAFFQGAIPAVAGIIAGTVWHLGKEGIKSLPAFFYALLILILLIFLKLNPILVILTSLAIATAFGSRRLR